MLGECDEAEGHRNTASLLLGKAKLSSLAKLHIYNVYIYMYVCMYVLIIFNYK